MKFSILVPVYNVEKYLEQCVDSLLDQTYTGDYEIILVDDGSTDSSGKICDRYAESNPDKVKVIHKENGGLVSARQAGINAATGEFSLFIDSDDFIEKDSLETLIASINKHPETDIIIFSMNYFACNKKIKKESAYSQDEAIFDDKNQKALYETLITTSYFTSLCLKAVKTDILKNDPTDYRLYYKHDMAEDWFRSIHLLSAAKKTVYINAALYNYRTNEASISRSFRPETISKKNTLYVYDRFREYLPLWDMDTEEYIAKLNARWLNETMYMFSRYYENAGTAKDRKAVLDFDWSSMLPVEVCSSKGNSYENAVYRTLFNLIIGKKTYRIRIHFLKKKIRKLLKSLLKRRK